MDAARLSAALAGTAKVSEIVRRDMFAPEATRGNDNTLWATMAGTITNLNHRYMMSDHPIELYELEIHDTWHLFILAAKSIDAHHPAQDRLTRIILWARELGVLRRTLKLSDAMIDQGGQDSDAAVKDDRFDGQKLELVVQDAVTANGRIWVDLPFMVLDVQEAWRSVMIPSESSHHRCNLAAAIARLASLGLLDEAFSSCGLGIMNLTLETPREDGGGQDDITQENLLKATLTTSQLLPLVEIWLYFAGDKLLRLSLTNHSSCESAWGTGFLSSGKLARDAGVDTTSFSQERFLFWKSKLSNMREIDGEATNKVVSTCSNMINHIWNSFFGLR